MENHADVAQLVEHHLAKVGVAGSNPVVRSEIPHVRPPRARVALRERKPSSGPFARRRVDWPPRCGGVAEWLGRGLQSRVHRFNSGPRLEGTRAIASGASGA